MSIKIRRHNVGQPFTTEYQPKCILTLKKQAQGSYKINCNQSSNEFYFHDAIKPSVNLLLNKYVKKSNKCMQKLYTLKNKRDPQNSSKYIKHLKPQFCIIISSHNFWKPLQQSNGLSTTCTSNESHNQGKHLHQNTV